MAEHPLELQRINWTQCCGFTHIFRSFRMAIHPGKLALALVGVILTFLWGWTLDGIWSNSQRPLPGEVEAYWQTSDLPQWRESMSTENMMRLQRVYAGLPVEIPPNLPELMRTDPSAAIDAAKKALADQFYKATKDAPEEKVALFAREYGPRYQHAEALRPRGIFASFIAYEASMVRHAIDSARMLNITGGLREAFRTRNEAVSTVGAEKAPAVGVLGSVVLLLRGKQWLVTQHFGFSVFLCLGVLVIWAVIGGAICRMAALNFARDERISPKTALEFARQKLLGFLTAPLLPLGMILGIGLLLFVGGLVMSVPFLGELIGAIGMPLALVGGFVMTVVIIGSLGGGSLFYPTIAVEGSDSFDAMSRSYSYIFSRPWPAIFYALVAFIYGAFCSLFVRFFAFVLLKSTRLFIHLGTAPTSRPGTGDVGASKIDAMWTAPTYDQLWQPPAPFGLTHWEGLGSWIIGVWVSIVIALLIGFLVSFFYCASTVIYFLLRREVDATDLEDVYIEEDESDLAGGTASSGGSMTTPIDSGAIMPPSTARSPGDAPPPAPAPG